MKMRNLCEEEERGIITKINVENRKNYSIKDKDKR